MNQIYNLLMTQVVLYTLTIQGTHKILMTQRIIPTEAGNKPQEEAV